MAGREGGDAVAGSQSCPYEVTGWLVDSERRQRCSEGRTATRRDLSSASSSAVFPYYPQRFNCRDTQAAIFLLSHSQENRRKKKKSLTCSFCSRGICLACSGTNLVYLQKYMPVQLHRSWRDSTGREKKLRCTQHTLTLCRCLCACVSWHKSRPIQVFKRRGGKGE